MFELEDYSNYHDGFLTKYADSAGPTLDFYITDSLQDMLDIDIRSEIANVVGGSNELHSLVNDMPSSIEHAIEAINKDNSFTGTGNASGNNSNNCHSNSSLHGSFSSSWYGANPDLLWSSSSDFYADLGACVNPITVMPLISSSLLHRSPKTNLNANAHRHSTSPPPASPNVSETRSHLTFSPAQIKVSAGAMRNEQLLAHIPKQIVAISSTVTSATTAPATLATNSALQRKSSAAVDAIKKDLCVELRRASSLSSGALQSTPVASGTRAGSDQHLAQNQTQPPSLTQTQRQGQAPVNVQTHAQRNNKNSVVLNANGMISGGAPHSTTNTIKLAPGIGGLTFANSITYNKLKQQSSVKSLQGSPITANGTIVLKRDRDSSPLHNMTTLTVNGGGQHVTKLLARNGGQCAPQVFTPKSIASAHSPLMQHSSFVGSPASSSSSITSASSASSQSSPSCTVSVNGSVYSAASTKSGGRLTPVSGMTKAANAITSIAIKALHQKIKAPPVESEYPKPAYSYSCLIAMALKNSRSGLLPVSEIYSFMCEHFPYFKSAPSPWKNSVRHNLSLNKCFQKIEKPATNGSQRKGCLWAMKTERIAKMDEEIMKWSRKDPMAIRNAMVYPEQLEALERGEMKHGSSGDSDVELDSQSEIEETSDIEEPDLDDTIVDNMFVEEEDIDEDDGIVVLNSDQISNGHCVADDGDDGGTCATIQHQNRDFDIEVSLEARLIENASMLYEKVEDIYDAIDLEDDKEAVRRALSQSDIIELSPSDMKTQHEGYQSPKRARLNVNYSIGPAGELEKQMHHQHHHQHQHQPQPQHQHQHHHQNHQQQRLSHTMKQVKLQAHPLQHQQQHQQLQQQNQTQHIIVQTITNGGTSTIRRATHSPQFQQFNALPKHNRRKMQLVNRIA